MGARERLRKKALSYRQEKVAKYHGEDVLLRELGMGEVAELRGMAREEREFLIEEGFEEEEVNEKVGYFMLAALVVYCAYVEDQRFFEVDEIDDLLDSPDPELQTLMLEAHRVNRWLDSKEEESDPEEGDAEEVSEAEQAGGNDPPSRSHRKRRKRSRR